MPLFNRNSANLQDTQNPQNNKKTLKEARCGETVQVLRLDGEGALKRRLMDMGITKGCEVMVRKVAPLGDPIEVHLRGYELSLRKADAEKIIVASF